MAVLINAAHKTVRGFFIYAEGDNFFCIQTVSK